MHRAFRLTFLLTSTLLLAACDSQGPAEQAGERIDDTVENAGDRIEDLTDDTGGALERAGEAIEQRTD